MGSGDSDALAVDSALEESSYVVGYAVKGAVSNISGDYSYGSG